MYNKKLVSDKFCIPLLHKTTLLQIRPLTIHDAVKDYDAVMSSEDHLRNVFDPSGQWPKNLTLQQNIIELGWHQTEFQQRTSFAYTVLSIDESEVLGCVYIYPTLVTNYDAEITMWVRQSKLDEGLDQHLYSTVRDWIENSWPFKRPAYPGRAITFEQWHELSQRG